MPSPNTNERIRRRTRRSKLAILGEAFFNVGGFEAMVSKQRLRKQRRSIAAIRFEKS